MIRPDHLWVGDITSVRWREEFVYVAVLMDVYTRAIRGWHLSRHLDQTLTVTALRRALVQQRPDIHHSDQDVQYAATAYVQTLRALAFEVLERAGLESRVCECYAVVKQELIRLLSDASRDQGATKLAVKKARMPASSTRRPPRIEAR